MDEDGPGCVGALAEYVAEDLETEFCWEEGEERGHSLGV